MICGLHDALHARSSFLAGLEKVDSSLSSSQELANSGRRSVAIGSRKEAEEHHVMTSALTSSSSSLS